MASRRQRIDECACTREISAAIDKPAMANGEKFAILIQRQFACHAGPAAMMIADDGLATRAHPFDRTPDNFGCQQNRAIFCIGLAAHTKATAHIKCMNPQLVGRHACASAQ